MTCVLCGEDTHVVRGTPLIKKSKNRQPQIKCNTTTKKHSAHIAIRSTVSSTVSRGNKKSEVKENAKEESAKKIIILKVVKKKKKSPPTFNVIGSFHETPAATDDV